MYRYIRYIPIHTYIYIHIYIYVCLFIYIPLSLIMGQVQSMPSQCACCLGTHRIWPKHHLYPVASIPTCDTQTQRAPRGPTEKTWKKQSILLGQSSKPARIHATFTPGWAATNTGTRTWAGSTLDGVEHGGAWRNKPAIILIQNMFRLDAYRIS